MNVVIFQYQGKHPSAFGNSNCFYVPIYDPQKLQTPDTVKSGIKGS